MHQCPSCGLHYDDQVINDHVIRHKDVNGFRCQFCDRVFAVENNLKSHIILHTEGRSYACGQCDRVFAWRPQLSTHQRVHTGNVFSCTYCSKTFLTSFNLKRHLAIHERRQPEGAMGPWEGMGAKDDEGIDMGKVDNDQEADLAEVIAIDDEEPGASAAAAPINATPGVSSVSDPPYLHMLAGDGNPLHIPHHKDIPVEVAGKFKSSKRPHDGDDSHFEHHRYHHGGRHHHRERGHHHGKHGHHHEKHGHHHERHGKHFCEFGRGGGLWGGRRMWRRKMMDMIEGIAETQHRAEGGLIRPVSDDEAGNKCPYCVKTFQRPFKLRQHILLKHPKFDTNNVPNSDLSRTPSEGGGDSNVENGTLNVKTEPTEHVIGEILNISPKDIEYAPKNIEYATQNNSASATNDTNMEGDEVTLQQAINDLNSIQLQGSDTVSNVTNGEINEVTEEPVKLLTVEELCVKLHAQDRRIADMEAKHKRDIVELKKNHDFEMTRLHRTVGLLQKDSRVQRELLEHFLQGKVNVTLTGNLKINPATNNK